MPKIINYTLTESEILTIERALKSHEDLRVRERARIIRLLHKGHKPEEVAELLGLSTGPIYYWHERWREGGLEALTDKPRTGRPKVGDEWYRQRLEELLATDPQELGYAFTVWAPAPLLAQLEAETGVKICEKTFYNILQEQGYVYRRPKHDLTPLQDAQAKARAQETIEELKKKPSGKKSNFSLWTKQP